MPRTDNAGSASGSLSKDDLIAMLQKVQVDYFTKHVPKNGMLVWNPEPHMSAYFVAEGIMEIHVLDKEGRKKSLDFCKKGGFFGFQVLNDSCTPMASARACVDSEVIAIPKESFFKALHACPEFTDTIVKYLYSLLAGQMNEAVSSAFYVTSQRLPMLLLSLGHDELKANATRGNAQTSPIIVKCSNNDIANILGVSRNSVTSSISRLQEQGLVRKHRNSIEILDMNGLERIAQL